MDLELRKEEMAETLDKFGQTHLLAYWSELKLSEKELLLEQLNTIDFAFISECFSQHQKEQPVGQFQPPVLEPLDQIDLAVIDKGEHAIREGKVAVLIVAGGQGSRLGFLGPKGCFPASPVKKKSLFQLLLEQVLALNNLYSTHLDIYLMTSRQNHEKTKEFFEQHTYFGLPKECIVFFQQNLLPAVDDKGKILLKNPFSLHLSPSGTGAIYRSLHDAGVLTRMEQKNISLLYYVQIDNPLVPLAHPGFIGAHLQAQAEMSTMVVEKAYPTEKVGVIVECEGKAQMCEYIHLSEGEAQSRDEEGRLLYRAANIAVHILNREFIQKIADHHQLPYFLAHKKIEYIDHKGNHIVPIHPNAFKFESFVFDALPMASHSITVLAERDDVFAPIKNESGKDSPASSCETQTRKFKRWLKFAGIKSKRIEHALEVEISPLLALTQAEFVKKITPHIELVEKQMKGKRLVYLS